MAAPAAGAARSKYAVLVGKTRVRNIKTEKEARLTLH